MTTQTINLSPALDVDEQLKLLFKPHNERIEELLKTLNATEADIRNSAANRQRFKETIEALTEQVDVQNKNIRDSIRQGNLDAKEVSKKRADRAACLEDIEINKYLDREAEVAIELSELRLDQTRSEIISLKRTALNDAHTLLREYLNQHVAEIRPIMLFIGITSELADAGWSSLYNELPNIHNGYEFSESIIHQIFNEALGRLAPEGFDSRAFMCDMPVSNHFKGISPLQAKARAEKIAAMEAEL